MRHGEQPEGIVIIGAGIIGCATAYYLTQLGRTPPENIFLIESSPELFASASGKAAGFLAADWFGPSTASLGALSFKLHAELAERHDGSRRWGYSKSTGTSLVTDGRTDGPRGDDWLRDGTSRATTAAEHEFNGPSTGPAWLTRRNGDTLDIISEDKTTGQVDPLRLSHFLLEEVTAKGVQLRQPAEVLSVVKDAAGQLSGVRISAPSAAGNDFIPCARLLITAGAWTSQVFDKLFPSSTARVRVGSLAGHSVVVESPRWTAEHAATGCHAVFTTQPSGFSPEIFSRVGGEIYVAGLNDASLKVPALPTDAVPDAQSIKELMEVAQRLLGQDGTDVSDLKVLRKSLCFRPVTDSGNPIVSKVDPRHLQLESSTETSGVYVAAGHGPWGISHSLGTGLVMAELLEGQTLSAEIDRLRL